MVKCQTFTQGLPCGRGWRRVCNRRWAREAHMWRDSVRMRTVLAGLTSDSLEFYWIWDQSQQPMFTTRYRWFCVLSGLRAIKLPSQKSPQVSGKSEIGTREDRDCQWVTGSIISVSHTASQTKHSFWSFQDVGWGRTWWLWLGKPKRGLGKWTSESKL